MTGLYVKLDVSRHYWPVIPFDACEYAGAAPPRADVTPLTDFPDSAVFDIGWAVQQPTPPPRWLDFGSAQIESRAWHEWHWHRGLDASPRAPQRRIRGTQRQRIIDRDRSICGICGSTVTVGDLDIDHVMPVALGGNDDDTNLQVTHASCNRRKGARI